MARTFLRRAVAVARDYWFVVPLLVVLEIAIPWIARDAFGVANADRVASIQFIVLIASIVVVVLGVILAAIVMGLREERECKGLDD